MRVAAITMVYNEAFFLPIWYRYYGSQLGPDNLYVIDHGSDDGSVSETFGNRIRIARDKFDDASRAVMISDLHRALLRFYDTVIYTDVDEFIVPRPTKYAGLADYAKHRKTPVPRCCGVEIVPQRQTMPPLDLSRPILKQRPIAFPNHWYCKPLLASEPVLWIPGFHDCEPRAETDPDLWLFHLKQLAPNRPASDFVADMYEAGLQGSLDDVDFKDVFNRRQVLNLFEIPAEFLERV